MRILRLTKILNPKLLDIKIILKILKMLKILKILKILKMLKILRLIKILDFRNLDIKILDNI